MKLERFEKNKKKKVYIVLSITVVLLVSVFVLYKSFALYEEIKEFNVINGVIPDFNKSDIKLAYTINGNQSNEAFPSKEDNYQVKSVECEKGVTASWNSELWGLVDINSNGNKTISCTVDFKSKEPICKRATTLHTEICESDDFGCVGIHDDPHTKGDTITYGQIGTSGVLNVGDAFDCDVNGDRVYDSETERFYYVNDLEGYNDTAVLIYYNNYGETTIYGLDNQNGPKEAVKQLPTSNNWSNISLKNPIRTISYMDKTISKKNFSYEGYAARLLSLADLNYSQITLSNDLKYEFLLENTDYNTQKNLSKDYWLENPESIDQNYPNEIYAYCMDSMGANIVGEPISTLYSVRPVIEIDKIDIDY